ncbi:MAG TPA: class I SAM-dependent methyltransferase [Myxococcales bacterium]|nr:class I SAM-dependent methyltransferase [Myxococcales bacterium]
MSHCVCPWWLGFLLANPLRKLLQDPDRLLAPFLREGMRVLEIGPGMGFFTIPIARRIGPGGQVVCVDVQEQMLAGLRRRARKAGVLDRIDARLVGPDEPLLPEGERAFDLAVLIAVVHELPDAQRAWKEVAASLKSGGNALFVEPSGHVSAEDFATGVAQARAAGFREIGGIDAYRSRGVQLQKS